MAYLQIPSLTNPLVTPWDEIVASGATSAGTTSAMSSMLPYLGIASMLLNPPMGPRATTQIGSPTQGREPIVTQQQSWLPTAASGGLQGAMMGTPFGLPGIAGGSLLGFGMGSGIANDLTWQDIGTLALSPFMAPMAMLGGRK